jgi:Ca2+-binding RTX toxin-like protein
MSVMRFSEKSNGFHGYDLLGQYRLVSAGETGAVLEWDSARGAQDPGAAARITLSWSGVTSYTVEEGPQAGTLRFLGGTLAGISYGSAAGDMLFEVTGLSLRVPTFLSALNRGDNFSTWTMVTRASATIYGSVGGDLIDTTAAGDMVTAGAGDDFVQDRGGADVYAGGAGFDTLSFEAWNFQPWAMSEGVLVDQLLGTAKGPDGFVDTISGFEDVVGTLLNDILRGNAAANQFEGGAGADTIDGRGGMDLVSYARDAEWGGPDGIRADLSAGTVRDGFGFVDRVRNVEKLVGTAMRDVLLDSAADNWFDAGAGNDRLSFTGGNDYGRGGAGADTFLFSGGFMDDVIEDFSRAEGDKIKIAEATGFSQLTLQALPVDQGVATLVLFAGNSITVMGVTDLGAGDFLF